MDEAVFGFGLCCTAVPVIAAVVIAWMARGRAEEAIKRSDMTMLRLEVLQRQLATLRPTLPPPSITESIEAPVVHEVPLPPSPRGGEGQGEGTTPPVTAASPVAPPIPPSPSPSPPPPPPVPPAVPAPAPVPFEWEKWIGVRGAAVLGGIVFAMAGLYLFKYSIAQGWVSPTVRVISAMLTGLAALVASQQLRARYEVTGQAIGGGGIVVLYAATWAAKTLYELIPLPVAFLLMVLITAVAVVFAVKQDNRIAAYLGLVGGFATPLMLSTGQNAPGQLFTYVFFLDVALLGIAYLKRWKSIAALALGGTLLMEFGWVFTKMEPEQVWIAFVVMAVFAVLFGVFASRFTDGDSAPTPASRLLQGFALLTPAVVLVYFGASTSLAVPLAPTAGFLALLLVGAGLIHRKAKEGEEALLSIAVAAVLMVLGLAASNRAQTELTSVTFLLVNLGLAAVGLLNVEWPQAEARRTAALAAGRWLLAGIMGVLLLAAVRSVHEESHLTFSIGFGVITLLFVAMGRKELAPGWQIAVGLAPAAAFAIDYLNLATRRGFDVEAGVNADPVLTLGPSLVLGLALLGATFFARVERVLVTFAIATLGIAILSVTELPTQPLQVLWALGLITALGVAASIRGALRSAAFTTVLLFGLRLVEPLRSGEGELMPWTQLFLVALGVALVLHLLLFFAGQKFHEKPWGPVALASALPAAFPGMLLFWQQAFGRSMQGALAVGLAVIALGSALLAQRSARSLGSRGVMWLLAAACTLLAIAVPLQLENQWLTLSWALMAVAYLGLWKRFDSRGLKWLALALLAMVSVRLLFNPWVLEYHQRSGIIFFNWLTYTYLIPAACLVAATWLLAADEVPRARGWESGLYAGKIPWGASSSAIGAALVIFAWVTLSVFDVFSQSSTLTVTFDRLPARDVALSLSWVVYAVALLAIGMWRKSRALRWMSLVFLLASIGKVFLYDLGQLKDLYRVASLMGLAVSLIIISLAYQRFVFRRVDEPATAVDQESK